MLRFPAGTPWYRTVPRFRRLGLSSGALGGATAWGSNEQVVQVSSARPQAGASRQHKVIFVQKLTKRQKVIIGGRALPTTSLEGREPSWLQRSPQRHRGGPRRPPGLPEPARGGGAAAGAAGAAGAATAAAAHDPPAVAVAAAAGDGAASTDAALAASRAASAAAGGRRLPAAAVGRNRLSNIQGSGCRKGNR